MQAKRVWEQVVFVKRTWNTRKLPEKVSLNGGMVDRAVDAVGYQAVDASGSKEKPNIVLDQLIMVTRPTGGLGIPGLYVPADPGAPDEQSKKGQILISFGKLFEKVMTAS